MRLYEAYSTLDYYDGFKNVCFHWFADRKVPIVTPEETIADYHDLDNSERAYAFGYVNELLAENEIEALRAYLKENHDTDLKVKPVGLPILGVQKKDGARVGIMGVSAIPVGGLTDFYMLSREETYNLDVPICGYFDLRNCEMVKRTEGNIVVGHDHEGESFVIITLSPGDDFSWEYPLTLIPHVSQMLEGIAPSQLGQAETADTGDGLPF